MIIRQDLHPFRDLKIELCHRELQEHGAQYLLDVFSL